jgi:hypothetical protein
MSCFLVAVFLFLFLFVGKERMNLLKYKSTRQKKGIRAGGLCDDNDGSSTINQAGVILLF